MPRFTLSLALTSSLLLPAAAQPAPEDPTSPADLQILVVATEIEDLTKDHYQWAAEMVAARLKGKTTVISGGLAGALRQARENPGTVRGIVEVMIDVYSWREEVRITCLDPAGRELWKEKAVFNTGGNEQALARKMLEKALKKAEKRPACGR